MKFLGGFIVGVITTILILFLIYIGSNTNDTLAGLTIFPEKGECITKYELEIFQTIVPNMALANFGKFPNEKLVLLVNYEDKYYIEIKDIDSLIATIPISEDEPNKVKSAFNSLILRLKEGKFVIEMTDIGNDLYSQVSNEYINQLNREIEEVFLEMEHYELLISDVTT